MFHDFSPGSGVLGIDIKFLAIIAILQSRQLMSSLLMQHP